MGKEPLFSAGTDLNKAALNIAATSAKIMHLNRLLFYMGHALDPQFNRSVFAASGSILENSVKVALRMIPIFTREEALQFLRVSRNALDSPWDVLILSLDLPKGALFRRCEKMAEASPSALHKCSFSGGISFSVPHFLKLPKHLEGKDSLSTFRTFYTLEGFEALLHQLEGEGKSFSIGQSIPVCDGENERVVLELIPT